MHHCLRPQSRQSVGGRLSISQIALDKFRPWIKRATMAFAEVIENRDLMLLI